MSMCIKPSSREYYTNNLPLALEPLRHETNAVIPKLSQV